MSRPLRLKATLQLVTPAVLGGARTRTVDPCFLLRPSAIRGALRYWFRVSVASELFPARPSALPAGPPGARPNPLEELIATLRGLEASLFGDTLRRSRLIVLPPDGGRKLKDFSVGQDAPGRRYLGYGLFQGQEAPEALDPAAPFQIELHLQPRAESQATLLDRQLVETLLWLWSALGGLGARARRGWGSFMLELEKPVFQTMWKAPEGRERLYAWYRDGITQARMVAREWLRRYAPDAMARGGSQPHPHLRHLLGIDRAAVLPADFAKGSEAMEAVGRAFLEFRSTLARGRKGGPGPLRDYFEVKAAISHARQAQFVDRAAFGLPLPFYFRSLGGQKVRFVPLPPATGASRSRAPAERLPSPLVFRFRQLPNGRTVAVLINFADLPIASPLLGLEVVSDRLKSTPVRDPASSTSLKDFMAFAQAGGRWSPPGGTAP